MFRNAIQVYKFGQILHARVRTCDGLTMRCFPYLPGSYSAVGMLVQGVCEGQRVASALAEHLIFVSETRQMPEELCSLLRGICGKSTTAGICAY